MEKVAIIGAGNFGSALAHILAAASDATVALWDSDAAKVRDQGTLEIVLNNANIVFVCVPSWSLRSATEPVASLVSPDAIIVSPTKGIEQTTNKTSDEVLTDVLGGKGTIALLHGPMLAAEMMEGLPSFATVASSSLNAFGVLQKLFAGSTLTLEYSHDLHGVALAGVLKNIYSIGLGMTEAMRLGSNFRGWYVRAVVQEMAQIIVTLGGRAETAYTSAGIGDLVATGLSPTSRNCKVGHEIVQSGECSTVSEGGESLAQLMELVAQANMVAPIASSIAGIVAGREDASGILSATLPK